MNIVKSFRRLDLQSYPRVEFRPGWVYSFEQPICLLSRFSNTDTTETHHLVGKWMNDNYKWYIDRKRGRQALYVITMRSTETWTWNLGILAMLAIDEIVKTVLHEHDVNESENRSGLSHIFHLEIEAWLMDLDNSEVSIPDYGTYLETIRTSLNDISSVRPHPWIT